MDDKNSSVFDGPDGIDAVEKDLNNSLEESSSDSRQIHLVNGNCIKVLKKISSESIDMVLCDPPFGCTKNEWDVVLDYTKLFRQFDRICKKNAAVIFFSQGMHTAELMNGPWKKYWRYNLIWKQNKPRGFLNAKKMPLRYHEDVLVFYKKLPTFNPQMIETGKPIHACKRKKTSGNYGKGEGGENTRAGNTTRYPGSVLEFAVVNGEKVIHPTQKPVELCQYLIETFTNDKDTVLDPCMGSGSTGEACKILGRNFYGIELDKGYFAKAVSRSE